MQPPYLVLQPIDLRVPVIPRAGGGSIEASEWAGEIWRWSAGKGGAGFPAKEREDEAESELTNQQV